MFRLRDAPAAPGPTAPAPPKVTLTGITTILGNKRALMKVQFPAGPGHPTREESYILTERQREGAIEVIDINEKTGSVRVNDAGSILTVTFDKNGLKAPSLPAVPVPGTLPATPLTPAGAQARRYASPGLAPLPTRGRQGQAVPAPASSSSALAAPDSASPGAVLPGANPTTVTSSTYEAPYAAGAQAQAPSQPNQLTPEEQQVLLEAEREQDRSQLNSTVAPSGPLLPVPPYGPARAGGPGAQFPMVSPQ